MRSVLEANADNWEREVLKSDLLMVVDFWHDRCPWCIRLNPILDEVANEYDGQIKFAKFNILESSDNKEIAIHYGIMSTPTLKFFCEGRPIEEIVGFMPKERLMRMLGDILERHRECIKQSTEIKT